MKHRVFRHLASTRILGALMAAVLLVSALPALAFAAPSMDAAAIRTVAQVETNGSLHVVEQRTFVFDESRSALKWSMTAMEEDSKLEVRSAQFAHCTLQGGIDGDWMSLQPAPFTSEIRDAVAATSGLTAQMAAQSASRDANAGAGMDPVPEGPSFCVDDRERAVYFFFPPTAGRVVFECDFVVTEAARVFDDAAELYWDYVPADEDARAASVNVTVQLPMPEGMQAVAGENVFAWGHGAAGTVNVKADGTIIFHVPEMEQGQYAQAHILFPQQWLTNVSQELRRAHSGTRLDDAKAEEESWTDTWSAWLANSLTVDIVFVVIALLALGAALALYGAFGREPKPTQQAEDEELYREYEAPLIGRLLRWNHESSGDLVALLMQLIARGALKAEVLSDEGPLGAGFPDMRFRSGSRAKEIAQSPLDREALRLMFDEWGEGYASVTLGDIARHGKADQQRFRKQLAGFADVLTSEVQAAGFFDGRSARVQRAIIITGFVLCAGALLFGVAGGSFVRGMALVLSGIGCFVVGNYTVRHTQRGADVEASALALAASLEQDALEDIPEQDVPYAFALDATVRAAASNPAPDEESFSCLWLAPRVGRGGKPAPSLAAQLAFKLEEWG